MELNDKKFAVLIDADNISHRKIKDILDEIVEKDSQAKIYEMNDILQNRLCGLIKSLLDRKVYLTEE